MIDAFKTLTANQFEAVFCTFRHCLEACPDEAWDQPVANLKFCQVAFHALFFADFYLGKHPYALIGQPFHQANPDYFRDYEELEDRPQTLLYDRATTISYLEHCRAKASHVIETETAEELQGPSGFPRRDFSRAELHIVNIRHVHHHATQLGMRLRLESGENIPWIGSGWGEVG